MEKAYNITSLNFDGGFMMITIDGKSFKLKLSDISDKLDKASDQERNDYKISPSGYGIHWRLVDEDLSINGLLKADKSQYSIEYRA